MRTINLGRVIGGGLLAGLVINISETVLNTMVVGTQMAAAVHARNLPPIGGQAIAGFVVFGFLLGIGCVWLYAAIRPRFGPGPSSAACAGSAVWFFAYLYPSAGMALMHMFPRRLIAVGLVWGLAEIIIATIVGAWVYREM